MRVFTCKSVQTRPSNGEAPAGQSHSGRAVVAAAVVPGLTFDAMQVAQRSQVAVRCLTCKSVQTSASNGDAPAGQSHNGRAVVVAAVVAGGRQVPKFTSLRQKHGTVGSIDVPSMHL